MRPSGLAGGLALAIAGSTASIAADIRQSPEPVDYVRVCDAYGSRFFYLPGTTTCLRVHAKARSEVRFYNFGQNENAWGDRDSDGAEWRTSAYLHFDARTETEFGTLRTYVELSQKIANGDESTSIEKNYIHWGGLLAGYHRSRFDFFRGYASDAQISSVSDLTTNMLSYTASFAEGLSATLAAEQRTERETSLGLDGGTESFGGTRVPDAVVRLRSTQDWGKAQIMGALHQVYPGTDYTSATGSNDTLLGWAAGAGVKLDFTAFGGKTLAALQVVYTHGASGYGSTDWTDLITDAVWDGRRTKATKTLNLTSGLWHKFDDFTLALEAGYHKVDAGTDDFDFTQWSTTANLLWEPVKGLKMGPELQYRDLNYKNAAGLDDTYEVFGTLRFQRSF
ncbi:porin [Roseibium denhamense]|nr:porin [Roseibium denhamense]MTI07693.1 porin [Roseibium denhamense]